MPKTREQIKHDPVGQDVWRVPRIQVPDFDPRKIRPMTNHILVELDREPEISSVIQAPDIAYSRDPKEGRTGTVVAVGPGKWHEKPGKSWEITKQWFIPTTLKVGARVVIGPWADWESWSCDDPSVLADNNIVLCQEADVRLYGDPD